MENIIKSLKAQAEIIANDIEKDSKAARKRVRKATLEIAKLGKQYRKLSIELDKNE